MPSYSKEYKEAAVSQLLPPLSRSVSSVCEEQGISKSALYSWLKQSQQQGISVSDYRNTADDWTGQAKLTAVIETATMSEPTVVKRPIPRADPALERGMPSRRRWSAETGKNNTQAASG